MDCLDGVFDIQIIPNLLSSCERWPRPGEEFFDYRRDKMLRIVLGSVGSEQTQPDVASIGELAQSFEQFPDTQLGHTIKRIRVRDQIFSKDSRLSSILCLRTNPNPAPAASSLRYPKELKPPGNVPD